MAGIFEMVDRMFAGVVPVADFLWDFPTNYAWYSGCFLYTTYAADEGEK